MIAKDREYEPLMPRATPRRSRPFLRRMRKTPRRRTEPSAGAKPSKKRSARARGEPRLDAGHRLDTVSLLAPEVAVEKGSTVTAKNGGTKHHFTPPST